MIRRQKSIKTSNMNKIQKMRVPIELNQLKKTQEIHGIKCEPNPPDSEDYTNLIATIPGPKNSPYELGKFRLLITFGENYPFTPPTLKFQTPVYHPNIDNTGNICLNILRTPPTGSYNPALTLESLLLSIQLLLATPNPDDPLNGEAADLFKSNRKRFDEDALNYVKKHALSTS